MDSKEIKQLCLWLSESDYTKGVNSRKYSDYCYYKSKMKNGHLKWTISYDFYYFGSSEKVEISILLGENITECSFQYPHNIEDTENFADKLYDFFKENDYL